MVDMIERSTTPRVQYAKTTDGVRIAVCARGSGPTLLHLPFYPFSHIRAEWEISSYRRWYEALGERRRVVWFDARGTGLSDRNVADRSLDALLCDVDAV